MPNRRKIWLFEGVKVDEIGWMQFMEESGPPRPTFSCGIHSLALRRHEQECKNPMSVERLLGSEKQRKESEGVTT